MLRDSEFEFNPETSFKLNEIRVVFVVLREDSDSKQITVLDVYTDEEKANSRVGCF